MVSKEIYNNLEQLGNQTAGYSSPDEAKLEAVANPHPDVDYVVRFTCPEFTSICPVTGQPDFAYIMVDYVPDGSLVESKSLKMYLHSFRNHGDFHEACTIAIAKKIIQKTQPKWLRIGGYWYPRGGIPIDIFFEYGTLPKGVTPPAQDVANYRGRG